MASCMYGTCLRVGGIAGAAWLPLQIGSKTAAAVALVLFSVMTEGGSAFSIESLTHITVALKVFVALLLLLCLLGAQSTALAIMRGKHDFSF